MDLFHVVTSGIDKVLTCHWFTDFKAFKMPETKLMDTERGGEQTQYVMQDRCSRISTIANTGNIDMRASRLRQSPQQSRVVSWAVRSLHRSRFWANSIRRVTYLGGSTTA
jgi:hypothetical protein